MTKNETGKIHEFSDSQNRVKVIPPSSPSKDIFSSKRHSMYYVTVDGVKLRTGYDNIRDWYFLCCKELLDNSVDFLWEKYKGASDSAIDVYIEKTSDMLLRIKIRNTNPENKDALTLDKLKLIFDFDMTAGSKQNLHIISRGVLGDGMKQVLTLPYVLRHAHDDGTTFTSGRQWEHPLVIRSNNKEFQVFLDVDLANQTIMPTIKENTDVKVSSADTEVNVTLPIIDEVKERVDIHTIEQYCKEYPIFTTDISFKFKLVDNSPDIKLKPEERMVFNADKKQWVSDLANALNGPARKAAIKIDYPALHPIAQKWNNKPSIHSYLAGEFTAFIESVHDKQNTTVYERLQQLRECSNLKMTSDTALPIAELVADKNKDKREEKLYYELKATLSAPEILSLPYTTSNEQRKAALVMRIARLHEGRLDTKNAVYKIVEDVHRNENVSYPYVFEIIAIPYNDKSIRNNESWVKSTFKGSVNYSVSPRGNLFEGDYEWEDPKKSTEFSSPRASAAHEILEVYNFYFFKHSDIKAKLPCVIFANLVTPRVDYHGADKSRIDTTPFAETIAKACRKIADNVKTYRAAGYIFNTKQDRSFNPVREKKKTIADIIEELLKTW